MSRRVFAVAAHPDDIEFMMAGTMLLLGGVGYELHYMTVANGSCGTVSRARDEIVAVRTAEARSAAETLGASYHEPLVDDIQIYYCPELTARLGAVVRRVNPEILLLQSPQDYMEDHTNSSRLAVTAAFCRGMPNWPTDPPTPPVSGEMVVYHALPHGLTDQLRQPVRPHFCVDISTVLARKREALACHQSQKQWLDQSQGLDSYLTTMETMSAEVGRMAGTAAYAEGWRRHAHLGFAGEAFDPLREVLAEYVREAGGAG